MLPILQEAGHVVVGLDTGYFADCVLGPEVNDGQTMRKDLRDIQVADLEGFDAVIHLAALSNDPLGNLAPEITFEINHAASSHLAAAARTAGVKRFLYSSTCSVYGASGGGALVDEQAPLAPITPYAISKVRVEADLHDLADDTFSPVSLRNATAFGFSPRLRADIVVNNLVGFAMLTGEVLVLSDGTPWRPLVHARDVACAFLAALEAPRAAIHDQAFNVGSASENLRVSEIAEIVSDTVPGSRVNITGEAGSDPRSYRVDFAKITETLPAYQPSWSTAAGAAELYEAYQPSWSTAAGAAELYEAYQQYGLDRTGFDQRFTRLAHLNILQQAGRLDGHLRWL